MLCKTEHFLVFLHEFVYEISFLLEFLSRKGSELLGIVEIVSKIGL